MSWLIRLSIILLFALLGHSLTQLEGMPHEDGVSFAVVGAIFAIIALFIGSLLRPATNLFEKNHPSINFLGLRVGVVGFFIALCGWLVAIYLGGKVGFILVVVGVITGFIGMLIHFFFMFNGSKHA